MAHVPLNSADQKLLSAFFTDIIWPERHSSIGFALCRRLFVSFVVSAFCMQALKSWWSSCVRRKQTHLAVHERRRRPTSYEERKKKLRCSRFPLDCMLPFFCNLSFYNDGIKKKKSGHWYANSVCPKMLSFARALSMALETNQRQMQRQENITKKEKRDAHECAGKSSMASESGCFFLFLLLASSLASVEKGARAAAFFFGYRCHSGCRRARSALSGLASLSNAYITYCWYGPSTCQFNLTIRRWISDDVKAHTERPTKFNTKCFLFLFVCVSHISNFGTNRLKGRQDCSAKLARKKTRKGWLEPFFFCLAIESAEWRTATWSIAKQTNPKKNSKDDDD